jgi:hypothetical protein
VVTENFLEKVLDFWVEMCYYNDVKREVPTRDTKMGDEVHRVKKVRKKKNSLLTNQIIYDIIQIQRRASPKKERNLKIMKYVVNQYRVLSPLGKMNVENAAKVATFYSEHTPNTPATANELGVSGAFMASLVRRGYVKVVGKRDCGFYSVGDGLYRKNECNEYCLCVFVSDFWHDFCKSTEECAGYLKSSATVDIELAQNKLEEAKRMLSNIEGFRF